MGLYVYVIVNHGHQHLSCPEGTAHGQGRDACGHNIHDKSV